MIDTNIWVTSDIHLFHKSIFMKYCRESRPFTTVDEMHEAIISKWNSKVQPHDTVWILGDISFGKATLTAEILNSMHGHKHLVIGNHDNHHIEKGIFRSSFNSIQHYKELEHNNHTIIMMHYPIAFWNRSHHGTIHLHGHLHGSPSGLTGRIKDVGMDTNDLYPYLLDNIIDEMNNVEQLIYHH